MSDKRLEILRTIQKILLLFVVFALFGITFYFRIRENTENDLYYLIAFLLVAGITMVINVVVIAASLEKKRYNRKLLLPNEDIEEIR